MEPRLFVDVDLPVRPGCRVAALVSLLAVGCDGHRDGHVYLDDPPRYGEILSRNIDVGKGLDVDPGRAPAVVVEVHPGGEWRIAATGDVLETGYLVRWDMVLSLEGDRALDVLDEASLDEGDHLRRVDRGAVRLALVTGLGDDPPLSSSGDAGASDGGGLDAGSTPPPGDAGTSRLGDLDVVRFRAPEGASLQLDVIIEGFHTADYVTWVGDGAVRAGAPSNPVIFVPVVPSP